MPEDKELQKQLLEAMGEETIVEQPTEPVVPISDKIKLGEEEYSQEQLQKLVGLGKVGEELESKWNTKIDSLFPAYTKSQQELKDLKTKLETQPQAVTTTEINNLPKDQAQQVKELLRNFGFVTKDELPKDTDEDFTRKYLVQRSAEKLNEHTEDLEKEIDGTDGRPAFKKMDILQYMRDEGIKSPETAYKLKYESELGAWQEKQIASAKKPGMITNTSAGAGNKEPAPVKVTKANLDQLLKEALNERT